MKDKGHCRFMAWECVGTGRIPSLSCKVLFMVFILVCFVGPGSGPSGRAGTKSVSTASLVMNSWRDASPDLQMSPLTHRPAQKTTDSTRFHKAQSMVRTKWGCPKCQGAFTLSLLESWGCHLRGPQARAVHSTNAALKFWGTEV